MLINIQKQIAKKFVEYWTFQRGSEKGEDQRFWNMLLRDVLGMEDVERRTQPQVPVQMKGTTKFLDLWIPETKVLIEHKSRGVKLDAPQSGHGGKTPYEQALEYDNARAYDEKARWIVTCNFDEIWVYDRTHPLAEPQKICLGDLPKEVARLGFLVDGSVDEIRAKEKDISIKAGRIVGELYKALLKRYADPNSPETLKALNRLCVRLVFLFYAEDADLFPKDAFWHFLKETPAKFLRGQLQKLFRVLDTPDGSHGTKNGRDPYLEPELAAFPYTNGGLFKGADEAEIPTMDDEIKDLLVKSADFDWRDISPTIFGALFESTLNPVTRRTGGMVYTSVENIHKVIDPLFLAALTDRVEALCQCENVANTQSQHSIGTGNIRTGNTSTSPHSLSSQKRRALLALQDEMASLTFLDPACGSGNFLTETYICLRRLENRIIAALQQGQGELDLGISVKVSIAQFHGIEINDFAVAVAKTALWIAEAQMLRETAEILHREPDYLPLRDYNGIVEGNALRMDWSRIGLPTSDITVISIPEHVPFRDAKAHLTELKNAKKEVVNAAGERFRFTKQIFKALSDKARDQSVGREVHWAAVAAVERLCEASVFLWDEKPRNGSVDILRYAKHGVCFSVGGQPYIAKITSKVYPDDITNVTYSVEAVSIERNDARGITDSIAKGQGLDPSAANRILNFAEAVKRATAKKHFSYIIGNPPFVGGKLMDASQKEDMLAIFGKRWKNLGNMDYVSCWYKKAIDFMRGTDMRAALVSTNSLTQGQAVASLLGPLMSDGLEIDFAWRTFIWDSESVERAHVHCVVVGFHIKGSTVLRTPQKTIFDNDTVISATNINGYLMDAPNIVIDNRTRPLYDVPLMDFGNMPNDGGNLLLTPEEHDAVLKSEPRLATVIRPFVGATEFINGKKRYCFWLKDASPEFMRSSPILRKRIEAVRSLRLASTAAPTREKANISHLFFYISHPDTPYLLVPSASSENRRYIPIGFMDEMTIASNLVLIVPHATIYHFGILTSSVHMAWVRAIGGRLKSDYRYSNKVIYNNFPWPDFGLQTTDSGDSEVRSHVSEGFHDKISVTAQSILDARAAHTDCSLAALYDDTFMPPDLRAAHEANDRAVLAAYGLAPDTPEPEIVACLFGLYANMIKRGKCK